MRFYVVALIVRHKIHDRSKHGADDYPKQLIPVEKRQTNPIRFGFIVEGRPEHSDELDEKQQVQPIPPTTFLFRLEHGSPRYLIEARTTAANANVPTDTPLSTRRRPARMPDRRRCGTAAGRRCRRGTPYRGDPSSRSAGCRRRCR